MWIPQQVTLEGNQEQTAPVMLRGSVEFVSPIHSKIGAQWSYLISYYMTDGECVICSDDLRQSRLVFHAFDIIFQGCRHHLLP